MSDGTRERAAPFPPLLSDAPPPLSNPNPPASAQGQHHFSPRTTSLSVIKTSATPEAASERFFMRLDAEFNKVARFTQTKV